MLSYLPMCIVHIFIGTLQKSSNSTDYTASPIDLLHGKNCAAVFTLPTSMVSHLLSKKTIGIEEARPILQFHNVEIRLKT